jgi:DNA-binding NtrC family response regulator
MIRVAWVDDETSILRVAERRVEMAGAGCVSFEDHASLLASDAGLFDAAVLRPMGMDMPHGEAAS